MHREKTNRLCHMPAWPSVSRPGHSGMGALGGFSGVLLGSRLGYPAIDVRAPRHHSVLSSRLRVATCDALRRTHAVATAISIPAPIFSALPALFWTQNNVHMLPCRMAALLSSHARTILGHCNSHGDALRMFKFVHAWPILAPLGQRGKQAAGARCSP